MVTKKPGASPRRGRPPTGDVKMVDRINIRILPEDARTLEEASQFLPGLDQADIARAALRLGIAILELDPSLFLAAGAPAPKRLEALKLRLHKKT